MQTKLKELTEKIYQDSIEKAEAEAQSIINEAKKDADAIIKKAEEEKEKILNEAKKQAADLEQKARNEIKLTSRQSISNLQQAIIHIFSGKILKDPIEKAFNDKEFTISLISKLVDSWSKNKELPGKVDALLSEADKNELDAFIENKLDKALKNTIQFKYDPNLKNGFKIVPEKESYVLSFTSEDFYQLLSTYVRPQLKELLFDDQES